MQDANGNDVQTYDQDHIVGFARLWTGFNGRGLRGNIELGNDVRYYKNAIDPMYIKAK